MKLGKMFAIVSTAGALMLLTAGASQASSETTGSGAPTAPPPPSLKPTLSPQDVSSAHVNTSMFKSIGTGKITTLQLAKPAASGKYVPEFDSKSSGAAIALLLGGVVVLVERRRRSAGSAVAG